MDEDPEPLEEGDDDVWPPPAAQLQAGAWEAEGLIERRHYIHAARTVTRVVGYAPPEERDFFLGLRHLAAAGQKSLDGSSGSAERQLAHARRRLARFLPEHRGIDLAALVALVEERVAS